MATRVVNAIVIVSIVAITICLVFDIPHYFGHRGSKRVWCGERQKEITLALHNYHEFYGTFPPAYIAGEDGGPMHSWRVLLLPFLDQQTFYDKYRFDEPWNSPHNLELAVPLDNYNCPSQPGGPSSMTNYVAVIGERTCWPGDRGRLLEEIVDSLDDTILLVEVAESGILWTEPRDLHVQQMNPKVNAPHGQGPSSHHTGGMMVSLANGAARFLSADVSQEHLEALLTVDGDEVLDRQEVWRY